MSNGALELPLALDHCACQEEALSSNAHIFIWLAKPELFGTWLYALARVECLRCAAEPRPAENPWPSSEPSAAVDSAAVADSAMAVEPWLAGERYLAELLNGS